MCTSSPHAHESQSKQTVQVQTQPMAHTHRRSKSLCPPMTSSQLMPSKRSLHAILCIQNFRIARPIEGIGQVTDMQRLQWHSLHAAVALRFACCVTHQSRKQQLCVHAVHTKVSCISGLSGMALQSPTQRPHAVCEDAAHVL